MTNALRACPARLQTLAITKLPHPSDSKHLAKAAADLALEIPSLRSITLRRATEQWSMPGKMLRLKEAGVFAVVKDTEGASVALVADEWRVGLFGRGRVARRHRYALPKSARG